jgi:hypothetical protein
MGMTALPVKEGYQSRALKINDAGMIVGGIWGRREDGSHHEMAAAWKVAASGMSP